MKVSHLGQRIIVAAIVLLAPSETRAQVCDSLVSRTNLSGLSGRPINSVTIKALPPAVFPLARKIALRLHHTTRVEVIRRDLLFVPGDTLDTLNVGESLRRLRHRRYLVDATITAVDCGGPAPVDIIVATRDRWTTRPRLSVQSTASLAGIEEGNLFGTGSTAGLSIAVREGHVGGSIGYENPWFLGSAISTKVRASFYPDGNDLRFRFRTRESSVFEKLRRELIVSRYTSKVRDNARDPLQQFSRETALLTIARRVSSSSSGVSAILFGADAERASLNAPDVAPVVGPRLVRRNYIGAKIGTARRAVLFDTLTWLARKQVIVDVPIAIEWEAMVGSGYESVAAEPAMFLNGWAGRMWVPDEGDLLQVDLWGTGYKIASHRNLEAASLRASFSSYKRTRDGVFSTHMAAEKLVNPDPDVRALANVDITSLILDRTLRLAEEAYAASVQQTMHVANLTQGVGLDMAGFVAASLRFASPISQSDHIGVTAVGLGLRVIPTSPGSGVLRLDMLYPVLRSQAIPRKIVFAISLAPWLEASRQREDPRLRQ